MLRAKVAVGQEIRFKSAARMAQMVWNDDLAYLAELQARQCAAQRDVCRNTIQFKYSGQNQGTETTPGIHYLPTFVVESVIDRWYKEKAYAAQSDMDYLTSTRNSDK